MQFEESNKPLEAEVVEAARELEEASGAALDDSQATEHNLRSESVD